MGKLGFHFRQNIYFYVVIFVLQLSHQLQVFTQE